MYRIGASQLLTPLLLFTVFVHYVSTQCPIPFQVLDSAKSTVSEPRELSEPCCIHNLRQCGCKEGLRCCRNSNLQRICIQNVGAGAQRSSLFQEQDAEVCEPNPCGKGRCVSHLSRHLCICGIGLVRDATGTCVDDPCFPNPCSPGLGACTAVVSEEGVTPKCSCRRGFDGDCGENADTGPAALSRLFPRTTSLRGTNFLSELLSSLSLNRIPSRRQPILPTTLPPIANATTALGLTESQITVSGITTPTPLTNLTAVKELDVSQGLNQTSNELADTVNSTAEVIAQKFSNTTKPTSDEATSVTLEQGPSVNITDEPTLPTSALNLLTLESENATAPTASNQSISGSPTQDLSVNITDEPTLSTSTISLLTPETENSTIQTVSNEPTQEPSVSTTLLTTALNTLTLELENSTTTPSKPNSNTSMQDLSVNMTDQTTLPTSTINLLTLDPKNFTTPIGSSNSTRGQPVNNVTSEVNLLTSTVDLPRADPENSTEPTISNEPSSTTPTEDPSVNTEDQTTLPTSTLNLLTLESDSSTEPTTTNEPTSEDSTQRPLVNTTSITTSPIKSAALDETNTTSKGDEDPELAVEPVVISGNTTTAPTKTNETTLPPVFDYDYDLQEADNSSRPLFDADKSKIVDELQCDADKTLSTLELSDSGNKAIAAGTATGCIKSRNYPRDYSHDVFDEVKIPADGFKKLSITLLDMKIFDEADNATETIRENDCDSDFFYIGGKIYCGAVTSPITIDTPVNGRPHILVGFVSDDTISSPGFLARWTLS